MDLADIGVKMWDEEKIKRFRKALLDWYDKEKRDLPWRRTSDPYAIWGERDYASTNQSGYSHSIYVAFLSDVPNSKGFSRSA